MLVLLVIVILALPHARPWAHKVSLRNSHSLLYVTKARKPTPSPSQLLPHDSQLHPSQLPS